MGDGTLITTGGDPYNGLEDQAQNGLQGIRLFTPCSNGKCQVYEDPAKLHLQSGRWYPSVTRLTDGTVSYFAKC